MRCIYSSFILSNSGLPYHFRKELYAMHACMANSIKRYIPEHIMDRNAYYIHGRELIVPYFEQRIAHFLLYIYSPGGVKLY